MLAKALTGALASGPIAGAATPVDSHVSLGARRVVDLIASAAKRRPRRAHINSGARARRLPPRCPDAEIIYRTIARQRLRHLRPDAILLLRRFEAWHLSGRYEQVKEFISPSPFRRGVGHFGDSTHDATRARRARSDDEHESTHLCPATRRCGQRHGARKVKMSSGC